jgi:hypothetical protein
VVLICYHDHFIPYTVGDFDQQRFSGIIKKHPTLIGSSRISYIVKKLGTEFVNTFSKKLATFFAECTEKSVKGIYNESVDIKKPL